MGLGLMSLACLGLRKFWWATVFCGLMMFNLIVVGFSARWALATTSTMTGMRSRVLVANVLTSNRDWPALVALIEQEKPHVVALLEVNQRWKDNLERSAVVSEQWPWRHYHVREDNFGVAVFSHWPVEAVRVIELAEPELPSLEVMLTTPAGPVRLLVTHPLPPVSERATRSRDLHLAAIAKWRAEVSEGESVWVAGDFNATPWCPPLRRAMAKAGLSINGLSGIHGTWPVAVPFLRIPIDHLLTTSTWMAETRRVGPTIGSDHLPVVVDLRSLP